MIDARISNGGADANVGVLAGNNNGGAITSSYTQGSSVTITGTSTVGGGLAGRNSGDIKDAYSTALVNANSAASSTADGKTTAEVKTPTDYTGIYESWRLIWCWTTRIAVARPLTPQHPKIPSPS